MSTRLISLWQLHATFNEALDRKPYVRSRCLACCDKELSGTLVVTVDSDLC